jgi:hypothetical protein
VSRTTHHEYSFQARAGDTVHVDVSFHNVRVTAGSGDRVDASIDMEFIAAPELVARLLERFEPSFEQRDDGIYIRSGPGGQGPGVVTGNLEMKGSVVLTLPAGHDLEVTATSGSCRVEGDTGEGSVSVRTTSGSVKLHGGCSHITIQTTSGSVDVDLDREVKAAQVRSSSGRVSFEGPVTELEITTTSGAHKLDRLVANARLEASSGNITAQWNEIRAGSRITAQSRSGSVRLSLPASAEPGGTVRTRSGRIRSDFSGRSSPRGDRLDLDGGDQGVLIEVGTMSGKIELSS